MKGRFVLLILHKSSQRVEQGTAQSGINQVHTDGGHNRISAFKHVDALVVRIARRYIHARTLTVPYLGCRAQNRCTQQAYERYGCMHILILRMFSGCECFDVIDPVTGNHINFIESRHKQLKFWLKHHRGGGSYSRNALFLNLCEYTFKQWYPWCSPCAFL